LFALLAITLLAIYLFAHPVGGSPASSGKPSIADTYRYLEAATDHSPIEHLYLIELDRDNGVTAVKHIMNGNETAIDFDMRAVIRTAEEDGATRIILVHNHPGTNPVPSGPDRYWMGEMAKESADRGVTLVESAVIGDGRAIIIPEVA
jgi:DNA repair protein RadC